MSNTELDTSNIDDILNASMDDLDDLPPIGVPPTGHYNLTMSMSIEDVDGDSGPRKIIFAHYVVDAINELKNQEEASEVAVGQAFREGFYHAKKDGTKNTFGIGTLKARLAPFADRFGTTNIGELIQQTKQIAVSASIVRKVNKRNEDMFNMNIKDMVLL